mmetsp:Transcript_20405/g.60724  ORF Transcript_20405/g.60724 Transcript_20405/m.60724 type:complete len:258 (-) Transcript_20405:688-1461(-)
MMLDPPGCSGSQLLMSSTMESRMSHTLPAALAATTSPKRWIRTPCAIWPSRPWQYSSSGRHDSTSAAFASGSTRCRDHCGGGRPSACASKKISTRSNVSVSTSTSAHVAASPASRTARVSARHGRSRRFLTGNHSPSLVVTWTTSVGGGRFFRSRVLCRCSRKPLPPPTRPSLVPVRLRRAISAAAAAPLPPSLSKAPSAPMAALAPSVSDSAVPSALPPLALLPVALPPLALPPFWVGGVMPPVTKMVVLGLSSPR